MRPIIGVYVNLICNGIKTVKDIPDKKDREEVRRELIERGRPDLGGADTE